MLRAVFLGHQGWLLSSASTRVLIDPVLTDGFGHAGMAGSVFPRRRIELGWLSPIDAVFLTHEHDDHFDVASLLRLDRRIPIFISARSSVAMVEFLAERGFAVRSVEPNSTTPIGDLSLRTFVADHCATPDADEWDVLPFIVSDDAGHGVFASSVDVPIPASMIEALADMPGWPGILCLANNTTDTRFVWREAGALRRSDDTDALVRVLSRRLAALSERVGLPRFTAVTGGGWSHPPQLAWVDALAFSVDPRRLAIGLSRTCGGCVRAMLPGQGVALHASQMQEVSDPAVALEGQSERPEVGTVEVPALPDAAVLPAATLDWGGLDLGLKRFARFLYARAVFAQVHSLPGADALGFVLHTPASPLVFAYRPSAGGFEAVTEQDPFIRFASGFECWAADLLALFEGRLAASALCYTGRLRCWNRSPEALRVSPHLLWLFSHPLHRPTTARALYEHVAEVCGPVAIEVRPR